MPLFAAPKCMPAALLGSCTFPEKLNIAAPQKVEATAILMPMVEPETLPSHMESTTPTVRMTKDRTSKPVGTCIQYIYSVQVSTGVQTEMSRVTRKQQQAVDPTVFSIMMPTSAVTMGMPDRII